ncbi:MAG: thioredoxin [Deltaproteobacteria bacterium]|nr:MAG: thioredoxin [Deltaproteobacteria bacterium]
MGTILLVSVILFVFIIIITFYQRYQLKRGADKIQDSKQVISLTDETFGEAISSGVTLVDFWAPWCGPCRAQNPVINKIAEEYSDKAKICKINVDDHKKAAVQMKIKNIPNIIIFKDGEAVMQIIGAKPKHQITKALNSVIEN